MITLSETLGAGRGFLRIDFYDTGEALFIGEMTVYAQSGLRPFLPDEADLILGRAWPIRFPLLTALRRPAFDWPGVDVLSPPVRRVDPAT